MADKETNINDTWQKQFIILDTKEVSKLFKELKSKGILNETKKYYLGIYNSSEELLESDDFIDILKYYRLLKRKPVRQIAMELGIDDETYREYELKKYEIQDWKIAEKVIKILGVEKEVKLPKYYQIMKEYPMDAIKDLVKDKMTKKDFSLKTGIPVSTINSWFCSKAPKSISTDTYRKMVNYFK